MKKPFEMKTVYAGPEQMGKPRPPKYADMKDVYAGPGMEPDMPRDGDSGTIAVPYPKNKAVDGGPEEKNVDAEPEAKAVKDAYPTVSPAGPDNGRPDMIFGAVYAGPPVPPACYPNNPHPQSAFMMVYANPNVDMTQSLFMAVNMGDHADGTANHMPDNAAPGRKPKFCSNCGSAFREDDKYCRECGEKREK